MTIAAWNHRPLEDAKDARIAVLEREQAVAAMAESWASIDGTLDRPDYEMEHMDGYLSDADELLFRLEKRGFTIVRKEDK